jgi:hypothetical protein
VRGDDGAYHLHTFQVFTVGASGITRCTVFQDRDVFEIFSLADLLPAGSVVAGP